MGLHIRLPESSRRAFWARLPYARRLFSGLPRRLRRCTTRRSARRLGYRPNAFFDPAAFRAFMRALGKARTEACSELTSRAPSRTRPPLPPNSTMPGMCRRTRIGPVSSSPVPALSRARFAGWPASARGYRCRIRPRHYARREPLLRSRRWPSGPSTASLIEGEMGPPLNRQELRARQDRFYADGRLRIEREAPHPERNVLVFVQCGRGFDATYLEEPRS